MADLSEFHNEINDLFRRLSDVPDEIMQDIAETMRSSIDKNFADGGRFGNDNEFGGGSEHWIPSAAATARQGQTLVETASAGLAGSLTYEIVGQEVIIGTNKVYGAIHNFGGDTGRGHKTHLIARPWAVLQDEDLGDIRDTLLDFYSDVLGPS